MRLPEKEQTRLYEAYWSKIENLFRGSERTFDAFVRDYIALRTQASKQEKADEIYFAFRREFGSIGSNPASLDGLLQELLRFARYHAAFSIGSGGPPEVREPLARLRRLVDVPAILVMRLFDCQDVHGTLSIDQFAQALGLIESYVFRRAICGEQTRGYWQVFANLAYRIANERPLESLKVGLARFPDSYGFPGDEDFRKALEERDVYHKRVCFDLLDRLENHGSKETTDTSKYSIEHIMPQNEKLPTEWREMLGAKWQAEQSEWLHRLGNLTLTGYNSTYSDRPFQDKKSVPGGFAESSVRLNKFVREQAVWTSAEMKVRGEELASRALGIWPALIVEKKLIEEAREAEMRERAKRRDVSKVPMSTAARQLFDALRERIHAGGSDIIELAEQRSVSYHGPAFFLEVLPRKNKIGLLLALDFNEVDDPSGMAEDASQWKFIVNALYEGGVYVSVEKEGDVEKVLPMIHQARKVART
jgi:predicted transport protein